MIVGAVMVPHPPLIVAEIGQGREQVVGQTIDAYQQAAKTLASWNPDTLIVISPHATMYKDYFQIAPGDRATGDFSAFQAGQVSFDVEYDVPLVDEICALAGERAFPAGKEYPLEDALDHGVMVPLYFIRRYMKPVPIIRVGLSGLSLLRHKEFGQIICQAVNNLNRKAAVVASGDLSHYCQPDGPYGFRPQAPEYEERIMEVMGSGNLDALLDFDEAFLQQAGECGHRSFTILSGILSGLSYTSQALSHQDITGVGYGICTYTCIDPYVDLAVKTISSWIEKRETPSLSEVLEALQQQQAGVFVSLHKEGQLRGCIGTFLPAQKSVAEEIIHNAISASTKDPRFLPVQKQELDALSVQVDVLSALEPVTDQKELDEKQYGILVSDRYGRRGLLLPDLEGVDSVDQQIRIAMDKAGIEPGEEITIQRFRVVRHQ